MVKERWWCIEKECKHYNVHTVHKGRLQTTEYCKHNSAVASKRCKTPQLGLDISGMDMCPVFYDMSLQD